MHFLESSQPKSANIEIGKCILLGVFVSYVVAWKYFNRTENTEPWSAFVRRRVLSPLTNSPVSPLSWITFCTTCVYESSSGLLCLYTLRTRREFEKQSETHEAARPRAAERTKNSNKSSSLDMTGNRSLQKLYVKNQGKCPAVCLNVNGI